MIDRATVVGLAVLGGLLAWVVLAGAGTSAAAFWQTSSMAFVIGGAVVAGLIASPAVGLRRLTGILRKAFVHGTASPEQTIITLVAMAEIARRDGLLALDKMLNGLNDGFTRRGLQMVIDGVDRPTIEAVLQAELESIDLRHGEGKGVLESIARFAPALGMMGTLIGLVVMLGRMDDPAKIGPGMAVALLTTLYGLGLANLVCLPLARRLAYRSSQELLGRTIVLKGVLGIQAGDNPRVLAGRLQAYLPGGGDGHEFAWAAVARRAQPEAVSTASTTETPSASGRKNVSSAGEPATKPMLDDATARRMAEQLQSIVRKQKRFVDAA